MKRLYQGSQCTNRKRSYSSHLKSVTMETVIEENEDLSTPPKVNGTLPKKVGGC